MALPKMLFVDDRSKRIHAALENYSSNFDVTIAVNVREALRLMSSTEFAVVSLDHDLDGCDFQDPESTTCGMEIVRYLQRTGGWPKDGGLVFRPPPPMFWIHSKNLFAANLMVVSLRAMDLAAFHHPFQYDKVDHMKFDKDGIPVP